MRVAIVVDREFGDKLAGLAARMPVWIVDSPTNRPHVDQHWALAEGDVTRFAAREEDSAEAMLLAHLADVDLHHGEHSAQPEWSHLEIYGAPLSEALRAALASYGVDRFINTAGGLVCSRHRD